jgi:tRNA threonylcarbamoyladenosine biosynthesis protein TsaB
VILGLDTATAGTAVAVWAAGGPAVQRRDDPPAGQRPGHAGRLLALVEEALGAAGAGWDDIERIAVGTGPGGFTGLRIGIATARALAQARDLPIIGVSSLAALAAGAREDAETGVASAHEAGVGEADEAGVGEAHEAGVIRADEGGVGAADDAAVDGGAAPVLAVIDARRGEVFAAAAGRIEPVAIAPDLLAARIEPGWLAVGDGAVRFRAELERAGAVIPADGSPVHRVSALQVCRLGAVGEPADRDALLPDYRREPDAKPPRLP